MSQSLLERAGLERPKQRHEEAPPPKVFDPAAFLLDERDQE